MLISHKYKFITIDIPKTGTRSLRETLCPLNVIDVVGGGFTGNDHIWQHSTAQQVEREFESQGWDWDEYLKFTLVRNPWKRYASLLNYNREKAVAFLNSSPAQRSEMNDAQRHQGMALTAMFDNCEWNYSLALKRIIKNNLSQVAYLVDESSELLFTGNDIIGKTEDIEHWFRTLCDRVSIPTCPKLKHSNKGHYVKPWSEYFDQEAIDLVAEKEEWLIEKMNYTF